MNDIVTGFDVKGKVDYDKLVENFGVEWISSELIERIEKISGKPCHHLVRRGFVFSHRSLEQILDYAEQKKPFYLYTGRGPSSCSMHLGHLLPFMFTKYLSDAFNVPVVIQITDDEKFLFKDLSVEKCQEYAIENIKDIIACGFCADRTFIFQNTNYIGSMYTNILKIQKRITINDCSKTFGLTKDNNIGQFSYPATQIAPAFSTSFPDIFGTKRYPCLIPCAIDQDPFFRLTRDIAPKLGFPKPSIIHSKFLPSLLDTSTKMSSSEPNNAIFLSDSPTCIESKIKKYAFSGGRETLEQHRAFGGNPDIDVSFQYLKAFEPDDNIIESTKIKYLSGEMTTYQLKMRLFQTLVPIIKEFQEKEQVLQILFYKTILNLENF